jgi:hypothetical protein
MTENDFFVAIQGIMTSAHGAGLSASKVFMTTLDAAEEWLEEMGPAEEEEDDE